MRSVDIPEGGHYPDFWLVRGRVLPFSYTAPIRHYLRIKLPCFQHWQCFNLNWNGLCIRWQQLNLVWTKTENVKTDFDGFRFFWADTSDKATVMISAQQLADCQYA